MTPVATTALAVPDPKPILSDSRNLIADAESIEVNDVQQHERAEKLIVYLKRTIKTLHEGDGNGFPGLDLHCELTNRAHKAATQLRAASIDPYERALKVVTTKSLAYEAEAQRKADEEARKREAEARKLEEDRQIADAQQASDAGDHETAEAILSEPVNVPTLHVAPAVAKVSGVVNQTRYGAECKDLAALVRHIAGVKVLAHPEALNLVMPNGPALNQLGRALKENLSIPGVQITRDVSKQVRSA